MYSHKHILPKSSRPDNPARVSPFPCSVACVVSHVLRPNIMVLLQPNHFVDNPFKSREDVERACTACESITENRPRVVK